MAKQKDTDELLKILKDWKGLEDKTIGFAKDISKKSKNALVKMTMEMIRSDSEKHKVMLQAAMDQMTKEAMHISPDELLSIADPLDKHIEAEAQSLSAASAALSKNKDFFVRYILSYLIADETKHHEMLSRLDAIKKRYVPY
ncbi:MAG: hypothetical protein OEW69_02210 [Nitrospirota bacterium]|nr:hypothetical protein [Nitrospirota bacterium]